MLLIRPHSHILSSMILLGFDGLLFVLCVRLSVVRTSERCYRIIFIFFSPYVDVDIDSHLDVHSAQFDTIRNVNIRDQTRRKKNPNKKLLGRQTKRQMPSNANGLRKSTIEMISRDKYDIQRPFANYDGLFIPVAVIYNFNWPSKRSSKRMEC